MTVEIIIIASILSTVIAGLGGFLAKLHIKKCKAGCVSSDCVSPPASPTPSEDKSNIKIQQRGFSRLFKMARRLSDLEKEASKEVSIEINIPNNPKDSTT